jgi:hypothetical protein
VEAYRLAAWRDDSWEAQGRGEGQRPDRSLGEDRALGQAERKVGR